MRALMLHPAARFLLCGGTAAAVNWLARIALSQVMSSFDAAVLVAQLIGMGVGFVLYRTVVWRGAALSLRRQAIGFVVVNLVTAVIVLGLARGFVTLGSLISADVPVVEALAHGAAIALGAGLNYLGHSRFTFGARRASAQGATI